MWPFTKRRTIEQTHYLQGWTDFHCHILPGVDDGFQNTDDSLEALRAYEHLGIKEVWLTPHTMEDTPNTTEGLRQRFEEFRSTYLDYVCEEDEGRGLEKVTLHLASEYMMDNLFEKHLEDNDFLTLDTYGNQVLVETSYFKPPYDLFGKLERLKSLGYFPVLAHPERYMYMHDDDYKRLKDMDVRFQLNLASLGGGYGSHVKDKAIRMLRQRWYNYQGTDLHKLETLVGIIDIDSKPLLQ